MSKTEEYAIYFKSITLSNIGAFGDNPQKIEFTDTEDKPSRWTVIVGENGCGKTTILESILALTPLPVQSSFFDGPSIHALTWIFNNQLNRLSRHDSKKALRVEAAVTRANARSKKIKNIGFEMEVDSNTKVMTSMRVFIENSKASNWPGKQVFGYRAGRDADFENARYPEPPIGEKKISNNMSVGVYSPIAVEDWLLSLHHTKSVETSKSKSTYDKIIELLIQALPGVLNIRINRIDEEGSPLFMEYLTDDGWVRQHSLGLGYKSVMNLVGDIVYRLFVADRTVDNILDNAAIVLIDEIDTHLHPKWQRELIPFLSKSFPNVQFICTAHSPLVVQSAAGYNIVLVKRDADNGVIVCNDVDDIANWRLDQVITSDLFDLPSARPPSYDKFVKRRQEILMQDDITPDDRSEIVDLNKKLSDVPLATDPVVRETQLLLRDTLDFLRDRGNGSNKAD